LVHRLAVDPDALSVVLTDGIKKVVGLGKEAGRHAWVDAKGCKGEKIAECHGAANESEDVGIGSFVIVPGNEALYNC